MISTLHSCTAHSKAHQVFASRATGVGREAHRRGDGSTHVEEQLWKNTRCMHRYLFHRDI